MQDWNKVRKHKYHARNLAAKVTPARFASNTVIRAESSVLRAIERKHEPPKTRFMRPERNQPHAGLHFAENQDGQIVKSGCDCKACIAYLRLIAKYNPKRFKNLVAIQEYRFFKPKRKHPSRESRDRIKTGYRVYRG